MPQFHVSPGPVVAPEPCRMPVLPSCEEQRTPALSLSKDNSQFSRPHHLFWTLAREESTGDFTERNVFINSKVKR